MCQYGDDRSDPWVPAVVVLVVNDYKIFIHQRWNIGPEVVDITGNYRQIWFPI